MKKSFIWLLVTIFITACGQTQNTQPSHVMPETRPTSIERLGATPFLPAISPSDRLDILMSPLFGKGTISQIAWSPDETMIAAGGSAGIHFYSAKTLEEISSIETPFLITSIAFSPDGNMLASGSADLIFSSRARWRRISPWGSENNFVQLWDVSTGSLLATLEAGSSYVTSVTFNPGGNLLASGSMYPDDNGIRIWELRAVWDGSLEPGQLHKEHTRGIFGLQFSPDGETLLSGSGDNSARLWDISEGRMESFLMYEAASKRKVFAVAYRPISEDNGDQLAALAGADFFHNTPTAMLEIWNTTTGSLVFELDGHNSSLNTVAYNPDGTILASGGSYPDNNIHLWDAKSGKLLRVLEGHHSGVRSVAFSPDGKVLASSGWDASLILWNPATGEKQNANNEHTSIVWSAAINSDGGILATGGDDGIIRIWNTETGEQLDSLNTRSSRVTYLVFAAGDNTLIAGTDEPNFSIQLWDTKSHQQINTLNGHQNFVQTLALGTDGQFLASGGALGDNSVRIWDLDSTGPATVMIGEHTRSVKSLAFNNDGHILATGDGKGIIRFIDVETGEIQHSLEGHDCAVTSLGFHPGTDHLVSGGCHGNVRFWDTQTGELLNDIESFDEVITHLGFFGEDEQLVIGFKNGFIWFWTFEDETFTIRIDGSPTNLQSIYFAPGQLSVVANGGDGRLQLWRLHPCP